MDADFSHPPENCYSSLLDACENKGAYLSVGSRYIKGGSVVNWPFDRLFLSWFASKYVRLVTGMRIKRYYSRICFVTEMQHYKRLILIK
jgi:dolichol-phosphate mannosyltransferase